MRVLGRYPISESRILVFDIFETLDAVVNKGGNIITSSVLDKIDVIFKLSDRLSHFTQSKTLSLVPPDGRFTLMEYQFDPSMSKPGAAPALTTAAAAQLQIQVPFTFRAALSTIDHGGPSLSLCSLYAQTNLITTRHIRAVCATHGHIR